MIARIERVPLRSVWPHEAYDFTQWLEENIDVLSEAIDRNIVNAEREKKTDYLPDSHACAVERRVFLVGANPTQQLSLRLVAAGAGNGGNDIL